MAGWEAAGLLHLDRAGSTGKLPFLVFSVAYTALKEWKFVSVAEDEVQRRGGSAGAWDLSE
jgi:hypothetical protein